MAQTITELYRQLRPLILRDVGAGLGGRAAAISGDGTIPDPHALSGSHHSGTLTDDLAPQFLKTDGSRALTGNLAVDAGRTIDGVDISAHVVSADAHHAGFIGLEDDSSVAVTPAADDRIQVAGGDGVSSTAGTNVLTLAVDNTVARNTWAVNAGAGMTGGGALAAAGITLNVIAADTSLTVNADSMQVRLATTSGLQVSTGLMVADSIAGNGLTITSKVMAVGAGDGIDVLTDTIAVDVTDLIGSGLVEEATNNIALGTPGSLSASTTNQVTGSTHYHAVTASSNPGAASQLLKSTVTGGLTTESFQSNGDITALGSLYAGGTGFRVIKHTHDYDHVHVVINPGGSWSLDEQFGLDVDDNLLVRGWIVGKHAIQLAGSLLLAHYDGPEPYELNYTGNPTGHMGQIATVSGGVIYRPGKFGKAVQIGEATTNVVTNPSFETGVAYWTWYNTAATRSSADSYVGEYCAVLESDTVGNPYIYNAGTGLTVSAGTTWTFTAWVKAGTSSAVGKTVQINLREAGGAAGAATTTTSATLTDEWQRVAVTRTIVEADRTAINHWIYMANVTAGPKMLVDAVQLEQKAYATPYCDGSMGNGHSWSGTAHASTSSRTVSALSYPIGGNIQAAFGTIIMWIYPTGFNANSGFLWRAGDVNGEFDSYINSAGLLYIRSNGSSITYYNVSALKNTWIHVAITWDIATSKYLLYINGTLVVSYTSFILPTLHNTTLAIGGIIGSTNYNHNGYIDDLTILDRAASADEIRAVYESNAPVFAETSTWHWRSASNKVWADSEGLWAISDSGKVLGVYCEAGTKSWGGVTLATNDLLIGDANRGGYLWWDDSAGDLLMRDVDIDLYNGATHTVQITAAGRITAGSNISSYPTTAFRLAESNGVIAGGVSSGWEMDAGDLLIGNGEGAAMWWDRSAGQLKFVDGSSISMAYPAVRAYIDTDGSIKAGAGVVALNNNGVEIVPTTAYADERSYKFKSGSTIYGGVFNYAQTSAVRTKLSAYNPNGAANQAQALLEAQSGAYSSSFILGSTGSYANGQLTVDYFEAAINGGGAADAFKIWQYNTVGAVPALTIEQDDDSEEFINLVCNVGAGLPVNTAALGTYYGKMRVAVNGTFKYMALYNS
jgi:hypothetical protein